MTFNIDPVSAAENGAYRLSWKNCRLLMSQFCDQELQFPQQISHVQSSPSRKNPAFTALQVPVKSIDDFLKRIFMWFTSFLWKQDDVCLFMHILIWWFVNIVSCFLVPQNCLISKAHSSPTSHWPHRLPQAQVNDLNLNCPKANPKNSIASSLCQYHGMVWYSIVVMLIFVVHLSWCI